HALAAVAPPAAVAAPVGRPPGAQARAAPREASRRSAAQAPLAQGRARDPVLLDAVRGRVALGGTGPPRASDVAKLDACRGLLEPVANRAPRAHVLRLLLRPDDLLEARMGRDQRRGCLGRERVELLETGDRDGVRPRLVAGQVVIDLPGAEDEP